MSSGTIASCPLPKDPCRQLLQEIYDLIERDKRLLGEGGTHGLMHRFPEQVNGANGPGTVSWDNHEKAIKEQQRALEKRLREYEKNGCGPPPPGAWRWATRPVPKPVEWKGPAVKRIPIRTKYTEEQRPVPTVYTKEETVKEGAKTAAKAAAAVGAGYIAYRVIRFLPSLFPPLWGTIPANAAIP